VCVVVGIFLTYVPAKCGKSLIILTHSTTHLGTLYSEETERVYVIGLVRTELA